MYLKLLNFIKAISQNLQEVSLSNFDSKASVNIPKTFFVLAFEIAKGLELFCIAIEKQAYSQAASLLRQLLEQVAIIRVLEQYPNCREAYKNFCSLRLGIYQNDEAKKKELTNLYKQINDKNLKRGEQAYLEFGWLLTISNNYGVEELFKLSNIEDLISWRTFLNKFVHSNVFAIQLMNLDASIENFIYIAAVICDIIMCSYHNITGFNFNESNNFSREKFTALFNEITTIRGKTIK